jgi:hypothetical protein
MTAAPRRRYLRKPDRPVVAVQLALDTPGFTYAKWGGEQRAKANDWLVDNDGDIYTVDAEVFTRTYRPGGHRGSYVKVTAVWAAEATADGQVLTKEGTTEYRAGDYLVSNGSDGTDAYAIARERFHALYELAPDE